MVTSDRALFYIHCNLAGLYVAMPFVYLQPARKDALFVSHSVTFLACQTEYARFASGHCMTEIDRICVAETHGVYKVT